MEGYQATQNRRQTRKLRPTGMQYRSVRSVALTVFFVCVSVDLVFNGGRGDTKELRLNLNA